MSSRDYFTKDGGYEVRWLCCKCEEYKAIVTKKHASDNSVIVICNDCHPVRQYRGKRFRKYELI